VSTRDKILIVYKNHPEINADHEIKSIRNALKGAQGIELEAPPSLEPGELVTQIREHAPTGLHFISHGGLRQNKTIPVVLLSSASGGEKDLDLAQLTKYLIGLVSEGRERIKCIFLNACYVGVWAEKLLECSDVVIGTKALLPEDTAQYFAAKFYEHVAGGCSLGQAYRDAKHAAKLEGLGGDEFFILSNPAHIADETYFGKVAPKRRDGHAWDAFIAYAPHDTEVAHRLAMELYQLGLDVFLDAWEIGVADVVTHKLEEGMSGARSGILIVSPKAMQDKLVENQYHVLLNNAINDEQRRLIPVMFENTEMPVFLEPRKPADFRGKSGQTYDAELERLRRGVLGLPPVDKPERRKP
jgi:hypothetical protein